MGQIEKKAGVRFFQPRRLGHVNLFVSSYERAADFYQDIVGLEEVYRQPDNRASFVSNGNTYHDLGLTDVTSHYAQKNQKPGLNHIAFEVENEEELVKGYQRAVDAGITFMSTQDHDVAHSLYKLDPEDNAVEVYADVVEDWRTARHGVFEKVKPEWIPGVTNEPLKEALYPKNPPLHVVPTSVFRARRVTHAGFVADDYEKLYDYYTDLIGLTPFVGGRDSDYTVLCGANSTESLTLFRGPAGVQRGMHHVGIEVKDESDLDRALTKMKEKGIALEREVQHAARRTVCILDPDGIRLQFYVNRRWEPSQLQDLDLQDALYLL